MPRFVWSARWAFGTAWLAICGCEPWGARPASAPAQTASPPSATIELVDGEPVPQSGEELRERVEAPDPAVESARAALAEIDTREASVMQFMEDSYVWTSCEGATPRRECSLISYEMWTDEAVNAFTEREHDCLETWERKFPGVPFPEPPKPETSEI
jgi:hypothetical protein